MTLTLQSTLIYLVFLQVHVVEKKVFSFGDLVKEIFPERNMGMGLSSLDAPVHPGSSMILGIQ
jgi:hypothetical protein